MEFNTFQSKCERTINHKLTVAETVNHAVLGLCSEAGEVAGLFQKRMQGHPLEKEDVIEELGDLMWFVSELCTGMGFSLEEVAEANIRKLEKRYPHEGFRVSDSIARVDCHDV